LLFFFQLFFLFPSSDLLLFVFHVIVRYREPTFLFTHQPFLFYSKSLLSRNESLKNMS
jgi:hypothetical protein